MSSESLPPWTAVTAGPTPSRQRHSAAGSGGTTTPPIASSPSASASASQSAAPVSLSAMTRKPASAGTPPGKPPPDDRQRAAVEVLHRRGDRAGGHHAADGLAPGLGVAVERAGRPGARRRRDQPQPCRGDDAERALGADEQPAQVVARDVLARRAADADDRPRREHGLDARDPGAGDAVLEAVRPAGVRRDVPADLRLLGGARDPAGSTGRSRAPAAGRSPSSRPPRPASATAADRASARAVMPLERDDHAGAERHRAAGPAGAAAARDDRDPVLVAPRDDRGDLRRRPPAARPRRPHRGSALNAVWSAR